ncbi:MAG: hypothetical protein QOK04_1102 [Solirubrobacteraceae bacterium]|jgi:hypothetical protein|nr:hypothetical protein [Solirubrobacteraceae bacterium]
MAPDISRITATVIGRIGESKAVLKLEDGTTRDVALPPDAFMDDKVRAGAVMELSLDEFGQVTDWRFVPTGKPARSD